MNKQTSINIDFIRLLLCIVVIGSHILDLLNINNYFNNNFDFYCVWLFFVLSGYLNIESIEKKSEGFLYRRFKRLLPKYYIALGLSFIIYLIFENLTYEALSIFGANALMAQHLFIFNAPDTNTALWSLSYEFLFYILLSCYFKDRLIFIILIVITFLWGLLNEYVLMLGAGFLIGILLNKYKIELDFIRLKNLKLSKYTYEIYIFHFPIMYLIFHLTF